MKLTAQNVNDTILSVLYKDDEVVDDRAPEGAVIVTGLVNNFGFHPERLEAVREDVQSMVEQLPENFFKDKGGGWSFLNMCNRNDGELWTGEHRVMEALLALAMGLGMAAYAMPRDIWPTLPGGVPYVVFDLEASKEDGS
jgi:hypothetical protein